MPVAICGTTAAPFHLDNTQSSPAGHTSSAGSGHVDSWSKIESQNSVSPPPVAVPYIHPQVRRSTMLMSHNSLEMCTESLGSETGTNDFDDRGWFTMSTAYMAKENTGQQKDFREIIDGRWEQLSPGNYHCSRRRSPTRSFPPPLSSISCHDGPCIQLKPCRLDGRLVITAIPVSPKNYLHACRHDGRLVLSFIDTTSSHQSCNNDIVSTETHAQHQYLNYKEQVNEPDDVNFGDEDNGQVLDEEEVEVVDRGTVVEVKVSTQTQQQKGGMKVLRSSIVINKFVGGAPLSNENRSAEPPTLSTMKRNVPTTTPAAAAAVAASSVRDSQEVAELSLPLTENKLLFTSKRRNREEMLYNMRRCSELRRPLFFWEQCCIASSK